MGAIDFLKINNFTIQFKDQKSLELMVTSVNIPGFSLGTLEISRPVVRDKRPGDQLDYNDLSITVICDEDLLAWKEIYTYIIMAANPNTGELQVNNEVFDCYLALTSNKNNVQHKIHFYNAFFKGLGDLSLESTTSEEEQVSFTADLGYSFYNFE